MGTMRILVRGVIYASVDECAAALGVSRKTVYVAAHRGTLDGLGRGRGKRSPGRSYGGRKKQKFVLGPHSWGSLSEASVALGYHRSTLAVLVKRGQMQGVLRRAMELHK
jgi:hypothetical protein